MIAANEAMLRCADRRENVHRTAPADLGALGVDRPDLRWSAARAFIRAARDAAGARIELALRRIILLDRVMATWRRRGEPGYAPDESDLADARLAYQRQFHEAAPSVAYTSPLRYGPTTTEQLVRLARDQEQFEAARVARKIAGAE